MQIAATPAAFRAAVRALPRPIGFVPTMGALHTGHTTLVERARLECASVVASVFVNPLQFGPGEDFERYPRAWDGDCATLERAGVAVCYHPDPIAMYPPGFATSVDPGPLGERYEGVLRPGHFRGVATVCTKLFAAAGADRAYFGAKDAQQVAVLRRLVRDLDLGVELVVVPTVREPDGLALSSRNAYLDAEQRAAAPGLFRALRAVAAHLGDDRGAALARGRAELRPPLREAYLDIVDAETFEPRERGPALVIGSAWLGTTRLLDNLAVA